MTDIATRAEQARGRFRVLQDGMVVASTEGPLTQAFNDALHYVAVYSQDGPVRLEQHDGKRWRPCPCRRHRQSNRRAAMNIDEIIAGMTEAQRAWMRGHLADRAHTGEPSFAAIELEAAKLLRPIFCPMERDFGHVYTRKGLAVRARLEETND